MNRNDTIFEALLSLRDCSSKLDEFRSRMGMEARSRWESQFEEIGRTINETADTVAEIILENC